MSPIMPSSARAVIVIYGIYLVFDLFNIVMGRGSAALIGPVFTLAVFTGLCARDATAWLWARWMSVLGAVLYGFVILLEVWSAPTTALGSVLGLGLAVAVFKLTGRPEARAYFTRLSAGR